MIISFQPFHFHFLEKEKQANKPKAAYTKK
jgi:hypothetical protein